MSYMHFTPDAPLSYDLLTVSQHAALQFSELTATAGDMFSHVHEVCIPADLAQDIRASLLMLQLICTDLERAAVAREESEDNDLGLGVTS